MNAIYNGLTTEGAAAQQPLNLRPMLLNWSACKKRKEWLVVIPPLDSRSKRGGVSTTPKTGNNKHMNRLNACNINFQMNKVKTPSMQYETIEQIHNKYPSSLMVRTAEVPVDPCCSPSFHMAMAVSNTHLSE